MITNHGFVREYISRRLPVGYFKMSSNLRVLFSEGRGVCSEEQAKTTKTPYIHIEMDKIEAMGGKVQTNKVELTELVEALKEAHPRALFTIDQPLCEILDEGACKALR
jgi:hypothetical protein